MNHNRGKESRMTSNETRRACVRFNIALAALLVVAAGCAGAAGTAGAPGGGRSGAADTIALYAGNWEGTFDISLGAGGLKLVLNHDGSVWTGEVAFDADGEMIAGAVENFTITEEGCSFQTVVQGEADIFFKGRLEEGSMVGVLEAYAESQMVADGTFVLTKK